MATKLPLNVNFIKPACLPPNCQIGYLAGLHATNAGTALTTSDVICGGSMLRVEWLDLW